MGGNEDKGKIGNALMGGLGLVGVKVKGKTVAVNLGKPEKENPATPSPSIPNNVIIENAMTGGGGISGLEIDAEDIEFNIGQDPKIKPGEEPNPKIKPGVEEPNPKIKPGVEEPNPNIKPGTEEPNPKIEPGVEEPNPKIKPGEEPNPNIKPGTEEPNPKIKPGVEEPNPKIKPGVEEPNPKIKPGVEEPNPKIKPGVEEPNPNIKPGTEEPNPKIKPGVEEPNPNIKPGTEEPNPKIKPGVEEPNPKTKPGEEPNPNIKPGDEVKPKPDPLTEYAYGLMYVSHTSERSIRFGDTAVELTCPGCCLDFGKFPEHRDKATPIICQGLHVQDGKLLEKPNLKSMSNNIISSFGWGQLAGSSIQLREGPSYGFDVICPNCAFEIGNTKDPAWCYNELLQGKHLHEDGSKDISTAEEVTPKHSISLLPNFAYGPMYISHLSRRNVDFGVNGVEVICPGCCYDYNRIPVNDSPSILRKGLHLQDGKVMEQPNIKPFSIFLPGFSWGEVVGASTRVRGPPTYGFDVICTACTCFLVYDRNRDSSYNKLIQGQHLHS